MSLLKVTLNIGPVHTTLEEFENAALEQFSIECRKTKTKVITLANQKRHRQYNEPIKTPSNYMFLM